MRWKPTTNQKTRQLRAKMNHDIREFFYQRDVLEVETPALSEAGNTDPFIQSFQVSNLPISRFLHTSPEYPMKRLLAAGSGDIYQICKVWRQEESGRNHNPEFTLLEWYRVGFNTQQLIQEVSELLHTLLPSINTTNKLLSYEQLFLEKFNLNPHIANQEALQKCIDTFIPGLVTDAESADLDQQAMLDALLTHCIEPEFDNDCLTFIYDYPASQSALAKIEQRDDTTDTCEVAMRFEVYLGQHELGNGYQEETSYQRNKDILQSENSQRQQMGLAQVTQDENFLDAAKSGIPESAGVAIGLDRVLMAMAGVDSIQKVINFPWDVA